MRHAWLALLLPVFALANGSIYAFLEVQEYERTSKEQSGHHSDQTPDKEGTRPAAWNFITGNIDLISPFITAVATTVIAIFTIILACVTGRQVKLARDEFRASHRPRIHIHHAEVAHVNEEDFIGADVMYVNAGVTPAIIIEIGSKIAFFNPLRVGVQMDVRQISATLKSGEHRIEAIGSGCTFTQAGLDESGAEVNCIGYIKYADARGTTRKTGFCYHYDAQSESWVPKDHPAYQYEY